MIDSYIKILIKVKSNLFSMVSVTSKPEISTTSEVVQGSISVQQNLVNAASNELKSYEQDLSWPRPTTDITKWDKFCPYQFLVVEKIQDFETDSFIYKPYKDWQFTLPLPPEAFSISTPFASTLTKTLDGIVEEDNGIAFRTINLTGTVGYLPMRSSGVTKDITSIFAGTVSSLQNAVAGNIPFTSGPQAYNVHEEFEFYEKNVFTNTTGFQQFALMRDFFENYAAIKKRGDLLSKRLWLALAIWKENQVFLVKPENFNVTKDAGSPLEYKYSLNLTTWRRVNLDVGNLVSFINPIQDLYNKSLSTLLTIRNTLNKVGLLKQALLGNIDVFFAPINDAILLCKDIKGCDLNLSDIPASISKRIQFDINEITKNNPLVANKISTQQTNKGSAQVSKQKIETKLLPIKNHPGLVNGPGLNTKATVKDLPLELLDQIPVSAMKVSTDIKADINKNLQRVRSLKRKDFEDYANKMRNIADKVSFLVGVGDETYGETYGINVTPVKANPSKADWDAINALNNCVEIMQQFASTTSHEVKTPTLLERFGDMCQVSGIAWKKPISKFAIPFPYGVTLETLAAQYLGNPSRFMEIVALNGLRAPYIDETGYTLPLIVNGKEKSIIVSLNNDLYVGKTIWLTSRAVNKQQFKILGIDNSSGQSILKLDGEADSFKVNDSACLEGFLTGTINSRNLIWIPSDKDPIDTESIITKSIPGIDETDPMVSVCGVDLLLGPDSDLVIVDSELRYAVGLANILQWIKIVFMIEQGELLQHRNIGLPISIGMSLADFNAKDLAKAIRDMLVQDKSFSKIEYVKIDQKGAVVNVKVSATVAGTQAPLPINFNLQLS